MHEISECIGQALILHHTEDWTDADYSIFRDEMTAEGAIGGSDAAAALGIDPYKSRIELWMQMHGDIKRSALESERIWCGRMLQSALQNMFEVRERRATITPNVILRHPEFDWMVATPDALVLPCGNDQHGILELKNTNINLNKEWADGAIADAAYAQVLHYMAVTGLRYGYAAALIGGNRFVTRRVDFDQRVIDYLIEQEVAFHESVIKGNPPEWTEKDDRLVSEIFPADRTTLVALNLEEDCMPLVDQYYQGLAVENEGKRVKKEAQVKLEAMLGEHEVGYIGEQATVFWQAQTRKEYTVPENTFRRFRIKRYNSKS